MTRLATLLAVASVWRESSAQFDSEFGRRRRAVYELPLQDNTAENDVPDESLWENEVEVVGFSRFLEFSMSFSMTMPSPRPPPSSPGADSPTGGSSGPSDTDPAPSPTVAPPDTPTSGSSGGDGPPSQPTAPNTPPTTDGGGSSTPAPVSDEVPSSGSGQTPSPVSSPADTPTLAPASDPTASTSDPSPTTTAAPAGGPTESPQVQTPAPVLPSVDPPTPPAPVSDPASDQTPAPVLPSVDPPTPPASDPASDPNQSPTPAGTSPTPAGTSPTPEGTSPTTPAPTEIAAGGSGGPDGGDVCSMTAEERFIAIQLAVVELSGDDWTTDMSSSRYQALYWLQHVDGSNFCPTNTTRVQQRYVVALLYFHMNGPNWDNCGLSSAECVMTDPDDEDSTVPAVRFLDASHECYWFGLECEGTTTSRLSVDTHAPLTLIELPANNLGGDLFFELFSLTGLTVLTMDGNKNIRGSIPPEIGNLADLRFLDLDDNQLSETWPDELFNLTKLQALDMNSNNFNGPLSPKISNLQELVVFQMENNGFSGKVPTAALKSLEKLVLLTMEHNDLTGTVEPICNVIPERRVANDYAIYLRFFHVDCAGDSPAVKCSCCTCY